MAFNAEIVRKARMKLATAKEDKESLARQRLAQAYQQKMGGTLIKPYEDDAQFIIKGDPYRLVFQYDDMFGSIVILNDIADKEKVVEILQELFQELKEKK